MNMNKSDYIIPSSSLWCNLLRFWSELESKINALPFYIQLSTVDHYGNESSYSISTLRHEQWQCNCNQLCVIESFSSQLIIAKHIDIHKYIHTHLIAIVIRFVSNRSNNNSCYHNYFVARAGQKSLFDTDVSSKSMNSWSWMVSNIY
jgi:hypothetical protein